MQKRILIVGQEPDVALESALEGEGHATARAECLEQAEDLLAPGRRPDLLLVKLGTEDRSRQLRTWLRSRSELSGLPVIAVTPIGGNGDRPAGYAAGAEDDVSAPFQIRELVTRIKRMLRRRAPIELSSTS